MITVEDEGALLAKNPIFGVLPLPTLRQLAFSGQRFLFADREAIIRQGDQEGTGYLLIDGEVSVELDQHGQKHDLGTVGRGFVIGAHAMIAGGVYQATVSANGPALVLGMERDALLQLLGDEKDAMSEMIRVLSERRAEVAKLMKISLD